MGIPDNRISRGMFLLKKTWLASSDARTKDSKGIFRDITYGVCRNGNLKTIGAYKIVDRLTNLLGITGGLSCIVEIPISVPTVNRKEKIPFLHLNHSHHEIIFCSTAE